MSLVGTYGSFDSIFGNGADGDMTLTGTLVLQRDTHYRSLIFSGSNPTLFTNSFRLSVRSTCSFLTNGIIDCSGQTGSAAVPGLPVLPQTLAPGSPGGSGTVDVGVGGVSPGSSYGGSGGIGGSGSNAGGPGGLVTTPAGVSGTVGNVFSMLMGHTFGYGGPYPIFGGGGGGGGGGPGAIQRGGGGGAGGGVLVFAAREILVYTNMTGTIRANGGAGGPGEAGSVTGGGGGGGGGVVLITTSRTSRRMGIETSLTGTSYFMSSTLLGGYVKPYDGLLDVQANPGAGGSPSGGGIAGSAGSSGSVFILEI